MKYLKTPNRKKGFTLIETLISILILSMAVSATTFAAYSGLGAVFAARDQVTVFNLAQEGVEAVKSWRDVNVVDSGVTGSTTVWNTGFTACGGSDGCGVNVLASGAPAFFPCNNSHDCDIQQSEDGFYVQEGPVSSSLSTKFSRSIKITPVDLNGVNVEVTIKWNTKEITIKDYVSNWRS